MRVDGRCHCGAITFEATVDPGTISICHCTDCQTLTGSAFRANVQAAAASFTLSGGPPTVYIKTADSGARRAHAFCPACGTPIYSAAPVDPPAYSLRVGTLRQRAQLGPPRRHLWCRSALPWSMDLGGVERHERQ